MSILLDKRRARSERSRRAILSAARGLVVNGPDTLTVGAVAARAGVSRLTVYQRFGSRQGLLDAVAAQAARPQASTGRATPSLREAIHAACERWASDPVLFRRLPAAAESNPAATHQLAEGLAAGDLLRPGCSLREAEDVIAVVTSFPVFDRLHHDGRRSMPAVAEILERMAASLLAPA
jgi:AcrR family transcriptional regulator